MPRSSLDAAIERRLLESTEGERSERYIGAQLDFVNEQTGECVLGAGGLWDRRRRDFVGDAETSMRLMFHEGQRDAAEWFAGWFDRYWGHRFGDEPIPTEERIYTMLLSGGQRGGKTYLALELAVIYALAIPRSIVWAVCPTEDDFEEVEDYLGNFLPRAWYTRLGAPHWRRDLVNGSRIVLRSAHNPESLKVGDADLVVMNEAQKMKQKAFSIARARIAAAGGLVIASLNPPETEIGQWAGDVVSLAEQEEIQAKHFHIDPMQNPHIDKAPLLAFAKEVDERTFDIDIRGLFLGAKNAVLYNWDRLRNEIKVPPDELDVTRQFMKRREAREYAQATGIDVQKYPHMVAVEFRWYWNTLLGDEPDFSIPNWDKWVHMVAVREFVLERAGEEDLAIAMLDAGLDPDETLLIVDASGEWQYAERDKEKLRRMAKKGRGSWDVFREFGFRYIVKPDRRAEKNPDIVDRFRCATQRICTKLEGEYGQRFVFSSTKNRELNKALRGYPTKGGVPHRTHRYAHRCDAFTYPIYRYYVRRRLKSSNKIKVLKRFEGRKRVKGW